jgi:hypothetical protein
MNKQTLIEYLPFQPLPQQLHEARMSPNKAFLVSGKVQAADKPNANKRIYDYDTLHKQVALYIEGPITEKRALGELDHPDSSVVNLQNVSHNIVDLWWDGKDLMGKLEILGTPSGNIAKELLRAGIRLGISSRGMGSVKQIGEGKVEVMDDFEIVCWDLVSNPSTQGAFMAPSLNESINRTTSKYGKVDSLIGDIISVM